jgi:release factor glutamine methyltransferase
MRKIVKYFFNLAYRPWLIRYLSITRTYTYKGIRLQVLPGVFHPGFFDSSKLLLRHVSRYPLQDKSFLEVGAGSGLISLFAAGNGARVTATDINLQAVECLRVNQRLNAANIEIIHSDLFERVPPRGFDIIAVNPPYYRKNPATAAEQAWYCGENGEYFSGFFSGLQSYVHSRSEIWMILCDGCDLEMIRSLAARYGWGLHCHFTRGNWVEKNFIFKIEPTGAGIL